MGEIFTFYSYKGGAGRTMALSNVGAVLAKRAVQSEAGSVPMSPEPWPSVLCIDWDLEAPGLHRFLEDRDAQAKERPGVLDLLLFVQGRLPQFREGDLERNRKATADALREWSWEEALAPTRIQGLKMLRAGRFGPEYSKHVNTFDWHEFYTRTTGFFEGLANFFKEKSMFTLIDSRTGVTDAGGVCTALMPDKLITVFSPNQQSLEGVGEVVRRAVSYRLNSSDLRPLAVFPLASRLDPEQPTLFQWWRSGRAPKGQEEGQTAGAPSEGYQPFFEALLRESFGRPSCDLDEHFDSSELHHVAEYAFGERMAVLEEMGTSRLLLKPKYEAFVDRCVELSGPWQNLKEVRRARALEVRIAKLLAGQLSQPAIVSEAHLIMREVWPEELVRPATTAILMALTSLPPTTDLLSSSLFVGLRALLLEVLEPSLDRAAAAVELARFSLDRGYPSEAYDLARRTAKSPSERESAVRGNATAVAGEALIQLGRYAAAVSTLRAVSTSPLAIASRVQLVRALRLSGDLARSRELLGALRVQLSQTADLLHVAGSLDVQELEAEEDLLSGRYSQAAFLFEQVAARREESKSISGRAALRARRNLAAARRGSGDLESARRIGEQVADLCRQQLGDSHPDTLSALGGLALTLRSQGDLAGASMRQREVLETRRRILGDDHPDTLDAMASLAVTLGSQGDTAQARELEEKVMESRHRILGGDHPDSISAMGNLAGTLYAQGDLAGAKQLEEAVLESRIRILGEDHPDTLGAMGNLALTLGSLGDLAREKELEERVVGALRRFLGEENPRTLQAMANLALTLASQGNASAATELGARVLDSRRRILGADHPDTWAAMRHLASFRESLGDLPGARRLEQELLECRRRVLGEDHPDTLSTMAEMALSLYAHGEFAAARLLEERVLDSRRRVLGEDHSDTLRAMRNLALVLRALGEHSQAKEFQERVLNSRRRILGADHPDTLSAMGDLAMSLESLGESEDAERLLEMRLILSSKPGSAIDVAEQAGHPERKPGGRLKVGEELAENGMLTGLGEAGGLEKAQAKIRRDLATPHGLLSGEALLSSVHSFAREALRRNRGDLAASLLGEVLLHPDFAGFREARSTYVLVSQVARSLINSGRAQEAEKLLSLLDAPPLHA